MTDAQRNRILLGEAKSAITQCTALLGADDTNEILAIIDQTQNQLTSPKMHPYSSAEQIVQLLIRFKLSLETVGVLAFDTDREIVEAFLRADRNAMTREANILT